MLNIVATPIGNLEDITFRAVKTLQNADYIACEDTRHAQILLNKYEIKKPLISFHGYSDQRKIDEIIGLLLEGKNISLISDAGTPGISDPGYVLIKAAIDNKIAVVPIPGPAAFLTALAASGAATHHFLYLGFLPLKKGRKTLLDSLVTEERTVVFYESPHRLLKTLTELNTIMPNRQIVVARELTKVFEEFLRGKPSEIINHYSKKTVKGEFVIILNSLSGKNHEEEE